MVRVLESGWYYATLLEITPIEVINVVLEGGWGDFVFSVSQVNFNVAGKNSENSWAGGHWSLTFASFEGLFYTSVYQTVCQLNKTLKWWVYENNFEKIKE